MWSGDGIAHELPGRNQIAELELSVKRIDIVSVLVDLVVAHRSDNVSRLHSRFGRGQPGFDTRDVNPAGFARLAGVAAQLWIAGREKRNA